MTIPNGNEDQLPQIAMRSIVGTQCTWWCYRRFWANNINRHPPTAVALRNVNAFTRVEDTKSALMDAALAQTASYFSCVLVHSPCRGLWLSPSPNADPRFVHKAREAALNTDWPTQGRGEGLACAFRADSPAGLHALRTAARASLLRTRGKGRARFDEEGMDLIDTEAASHPKWRAFLQTLNFRQKTQLDIWRSGAIWTPTRRYASPNDQRGPEAPHSTGNEPSSTGS